jgi:hypothetical protein
MKDKKMATRNQLEIASHIRGVWNELLRIKRVAPSLKRSAAAIDILKRQVADLKVMLSGRMSGVNIPLNQILIAEGVDISSAFKKPFRTEEEAFDIAPISGDDLLSDVIRATRNLADGVAQSLEEIVVGVKLPPEPPIKIPEADYVKTSYTFTFVATKKHNRTPRKVEVRFEMVLRKNGLQWIGYGKDVSLINTPTEEEEKIVIAVEEAIRIIDSGYHDFIYEIQNDETEIHAWGRLKSLLSAEDVVLEGTEMGVEMVDAAVWEGRKRYPFALYVEDHTYQVRKIGNVGILDDLWWTLSWQELAGVIAAGAWKDIAGQRGPQAGRTYSNMGRPVETSKQTTLTEGKKKVTRAQMLRRRRTGL